MLVQKYVLNTPLPQLVSYRPLQKTAVKQKQTTWVFRQRSGACPHAKQSFGAAESYTVHFACCTAHSLLKTIVFVQSICSKPNPICPYGRCFAAVPSLALCLRYVRGIIYKGNRPDRPTMLVQEMVAFRHPFITHSPFQRLLKDMNRATESRARLALSMKRSDAQMISNVSDCRTRIIKQSAGQGSLALCPACCVKGFVEPSRNIGTDGQLPCVEALQVESSMARLA